MLSLFEYIKFMPKSPDNEFCELSNVIERGQITPNILAKYCIPKKSFYDFNFFTENDIIQLYNELKIKCPNKLEELIIQLVIPEFKYWSSLCVTHFDNIIKEKNTNINYNLIYSQFYKLLQLSNNYYEDSYI